MVSINRSFGNNGVNGLNPSSRRTQLEKEGDKPKTVVDELQIYRLNKDGVQTLLYDDGVNDGHVVFLDQNNKVIGRE